MIFAFRLFHYLIKKWGVSMMHGQVFIKGRGGEGTGWHFSYLIFSRFAISTFRSYFTKSSSASGCSQYHPTSAADISSCVVCAAADNVFAISSNVHVDKCLCCKAKVWCALQLMTLLNYFTLCKIVLCILRKIIFF